MTAEDAVRYDDLMWCCTNLCELLQVENDAIANHDAETVRELAENKAALARLYEQSVRPMADDPALVETLTPEQKEELKTLGTQLAHLVKDNVRLLRAEMECCDRLMEALVGAVKAQATSTVAYGRAGSFEIPHRPAERPTLTLDKTF
jgi:hypothetical protein